MRTAFSVERTEDDYFAAIEGKTAALMASSCRVGALTAQLPEDQRDALTEFGRCFGMIYQLRDDILDVIATDNELGKPAGQDLAEGIYNLPTIFALRDANVGDELRGVLGAVLDDEDRERARKLVVATDGIERTIAAAQTLPRPSPRRAGDAAQRPLRDGFGVAHRVAARGPAEVLVAIGLSVGKAITSRMFDSSAISIARRSIPSPSPAVGGSPHSSALM